MRQPYEPKMEYLERRRKEAETLGLNGYMSSLDNILLSDYSFKEMIEMTKIADFTVESVFLALERGHTSYEMKKYGLMAVRHYTAAELSASTIRPITLKRLLTLFFFTNFRDNTKPSLDLFERLEVSGIATAKKYKEIAERLNLSYDYAPNIHTVLDSVEKEPRS